MIFARFFDIQFWYNGEKLEPAVPVEVTITYAETVETSGDVSCQAVHFTEEGTEVLQATTEQKEDGSTSFTHTQNGFSVVGNVVTMAMNANAADVGPDALPVDYYVCIDGVWERIDALWKATLPPPAMTIFLPSMRMPMGRNEYLYFPISQSLCRPHSRWRGLSHHQRPDLMSSPGCTALVQGRQPIEG